jgi:hypothetical protein
MRKSPIREGKVVRRTEEFRATVAMRLAASRLISVSAARNTLLTNNNKKFMQSRSYEQALVICLSSLNL